MEPSIRYARTEDGVSIAYWALGDGYPLIADVGDWSHVQREWDIPERRAYSERAARNHTFIRFDHRGSGLSDRTVTDLSIDAYARDLDAVLDHMGLSEAAIFATGGGQRSAIDYAAKHPQRISHLILWQAMGLDGTIPPALKVLLDMRDADWEFYTDAFVLWVQGWTAGEASARMGEYLRASISPEVAKAIDAAQRSVNVMPLLEQLSMPTLLVYRPDARGFSEDMLRQIASRIPQARSVFLEGTTLAWYIPDSERLMSTIEEFIAEYPSSSQAKQKAGNVQELVSDTHVVLFTDIAGSSALAQRVGDAQAQEVRRAHDAIVREALQAHRGKEVKHTGDGIMAAFGMASAALNCAITIQRSIAVHNEDHGHMPLGVYIGLNAGEPIAENDDLFGTSVDLAARICDHADAGQILASDVVRQLVAGKHYLWNDRGTSELRGLEDPIKLWEVSWAEDA